MFEIVSNVTKVQLIATGHPPEDTQETTWQQTLAQTERGCYRSVSERITSPG